MPAGPKKGVGESEGGCLTPGCGTWGWDLHGKASKAEGPSPGILHAHISCQAKSCLEAHTLSPYPRGCPGCQLLPSAGSEGHCWELRARIPSLGQQGHTGALSQNSCPSKETVGRGLSL